tara:strand:- start:6169 stop:6438 length:270 start_codon:yes stop_codon:yes gene_type:complete
MSSARNVHFERSRALGSLNASALGATTSMTAGQRFLAGSALIYAGLGFPGYKKLGKGLKNIAQYRKRESLENFAVGAGVYLVLQGVLIG